VTLENGRQTIIAVQLKSDVRKGDSVVLLVEQDAANSSRKRYNYFKEVDQ